MSLDKQAVERAVIEGTNLNVLCYDNSAKPGEFTTLLLHIMSSCMLHGLQDELCVVFSPLPLPPVERHWTDKRPFYEVEINAGPEHDYTHYFLYNAQAAGASLAHGNKYLVVGIGKGGNPILGSF